MKGVSMMLRWVVVVLVGATAGCGGSPSQHGDGGVVCGTCASLGKNCGQAPDGCGGTLNCGMCPTGQNCGGGGGPNLCGTGTCTPKDCAAQMKNCGLVSDGCAATLNCGMCPMGQTCGGNNVCTTSTCTPTTTCAAKGYDCGMLNDGCQMVSCGSCGAPRTCAGGGQMNVCGKACASGCPMGWTCNRDGVCVGGDRMNLVFNENGHVVGGKLTLNGATPTVTPGCFGGSSTIWFNEVNHGYQFSFSPACSDPTFSFLSVRGITDGTYRVTAANSTGGSNLPNDTMLINPALVVAADQPNLTLDVKVVTVSGKVTLNGASPGLPAGCTGLQVNMHFIDASRAIDHVAGIYCTANWPFSVQLEPGTYQVNVTSSDPSNAFPPQKIVVNPALVVSSSASNLALDVKLVNVSGTLQVNGATPTPGTACVDPKAVVTFTDTTYGTTFVTSVPCASATYAFSAQVAPGTYKVSMRGTVAGSNLPQGNVVAAPSLAVSGAMSNVVLGATAVTVSGNVTLNGGAPAVAGGCAGQAAQVTFTDASGSAFTTGIPCSTTNFAYATAVPAGTYKTTVLGLTGSNLPAVAVVANAAASLSTNTTGLALPVRAATIAGTVTMNGGVPVSGSCLSEPKFSVTWTENTYGYSLVSLVPCASVNSYASTVLPLGTYSAQVYFKEGTRYRVLLAPAAITADNPSLNLDARTVTVSGTLTLNGAPATTPTTCATQAATVTFANARNGNSAFQSQIPCNGANARWSVDVFPDTYEVDITEILSTVGDRTVLQPSLVVSGPMSNVVFDIKTVSVAGRVTLNGALPTAVGTCNEPLVGIDWTQPVSPFSPFLTIGPPVFCASAVDFSFAGDTYAGTKKIVLNTVNSSNLPYGAYTAVDQLRLP